jgi:hypothetical protein
MNSSFQKYWIIILAVSLIGCAKRGSITGGSRDTLAPNMIGSFPKNFVTDFKGNVIKLNFDEYVKLKDATKQLVVSPPLKYAPELLPYSASKQIIIKFRDTLLPNTTYSFNFGNSIEDNNEGNALSQFKYIFSTGSYIDSLSINVKIADALERKVDNFVSVMLYEVDENFTDSIIYKKQPRYITNTLDSLKVVKLENLKAGKYQLIAIKDGNKNNKYEPKSDKLAFRIKPFSIPNDTVFVLDLFKEKQKYKALNVSQVSGNKLSLGYEGDYKNMKLDIKNGSNSVPFKMSRTDSKKDSLNIWFKANKGDSIVVTSSKDKFSKEFSLKIKDQKKDTLTLGAVQTSTLKFRENFAIRSSLPIESWDKSKIKLINKDSVAVDFTTNYLEEEQQLEFLFKKEALQNYKFQVLPGGITDFFGGRNDTLNYKFTTGNTSEFGNVRVKLTNVKRFPLIVQLTDKEGKVLASEWSEKETYLTFDLVDPNMYTIRLIYDDNGNKIWDVGSYLEKRLSEEVIYYPEEIRVNANWDREETFNAGG